MRLTAFVVILAFGLAGCTEPSPPPVAQQTVQSTRSSQSSQSSLGTVPPVPRTLDMGKYSGNPCTLLGKEDLDALGFAGQYVVIPRDRTCVVGGGSGGGTLHLSLDADAQPLQQAYADSSGEFEFRHAIDLVGLPAVVRARSVTYPLGCDVIIATGRQQGLSLGHTPSTRQGGTIGICGRLTTVAETLLNKLGA